MVLAKCGDMRVCTQLCGFFSSDSEAVDVICSGRKSFLSVKHISPILISPVDFKLSSKISGLTSGFNSGIQDCHKKRVLLAKKRINLLNHRIAGQDSLREGTSMLGRLSKHKTFLYLSFTNIGKVTALFFQISFKVKLLSLKPVYQSYCYYFQIVSQKMNYSENKTFLFRNYCFEFIGTFTEILHFKKIITYAKACIFNRD